MHVLEMSNGNGYKIELRCHKRLWQVIGIIKCPLGWFTFNQNPENLRCLHAARLHVEHAFDKDWR